MSVPERVYTWALRGARPLLPLLARGEGKLARGVRGRAGVVERLAAWAAAERDPERPLAWFHAPSVGEGLQARAVMEALLRRRPEVQVAYTHFSPSAERFARSVPAGVADYLPLDLPEAVGRALDALRPDALVFSKTDVWPNLTREAAARGVPMALLSATLPASSSRLRGPARAWLSAAYGRLDVVAAISPGDAGHFAALGVPPERRTVMGDAHFDRVWARAAGVDRHSELLRGLRAPGRVTLVAGSTWPADEDRLLEALPGADGPRWRLVLVPHEPTPEHLRRLEARLDATALAHRRLGAPEPAVGADVVVVDRVGVLGELYAAADAAYVGGGWGTAGLHSVLEPAAFGLPVVFGPRHANAREAAELIAAGAALSPADPVALRSALLDLLRDPERRRTMGAEAAASVRAGLGAAERGAEIVEHLLDR